MSAPPPPVESPRSMAVRGFLIGDELAANDAGNQLTVEVRRKGGDDRNQLTVVGSYSHSTCTTDSGERNNRHIQLAY